MGFALVATVLTLVVLAFPASAKGFSVARFTGPGLPAGGVSVDGAPSVNGKLSPIWQLGLEAPKVPGPGARGVPKRKLGPAYDGRFRTDWAPRFLLIQVVYPYAPRGPWTYTPPGQHVEGVRVPGGWYHGSPRLLRFLVAFGFPATAPTATKVGAAKPAAPAHAAAAQSSSDRSRPVWLWILIGFGVGIAALLTAARRRRRMA